MSLNLRVLLVQCQRQMQVLAVPVIQILVTIVDCVASTVHPRVVSHAPVHLVCLGHYVRQVRAASYICLC